MKNNRVWVLSLCLTLFWIGVIFFASQQPAREQDIKPYLAERVWIKEGVLQAPQIQFHYAGRFHDSHENPLGFAQFMLRKAAHFFLYGLFGLSLLVFLYSGGMKRLKSGLTAGMVVALVAVSDETLQYFSLGRTGCFDDVILDLSGFVFFYGLFLILTRDKNCRPQKR